MDKPNSIYGDLDLPPVDTAALKEGDDVLTRIFWNNSVAGSPAKVISVKRNETSVSAYCDYGVNLSNKPLRKWMPAFALCARPETKE